MNKNIAILSAIILLTGAIAVSAQNTDLTAGDYSRAESMLNFNTSKLIDRFGVRPIWLPDGRFWYRVMTPEASEYVLVDHASGQQRTSTDKSTLLAEIPGTEEGDEQGRRVEAATSPDGKMIAFIRDHNLWIREIESKNERQLTIDGAENFGYATDNAGWRKSVQPVLLWSPDSKKIVTYQQDQRHVSDMYLVSTQVGAPALQAWKYPIPGDKEIIKIHRVIIEVETGKIIRLKIGADARRGTLCDDISCSGAFDDNEWSPDASKLAFVSSSRDHKSAKLRIADAASGEVREVMEEKVDTQYESGRGAINWRYLADSKEFIWYSQRDDWGHLYLYDAADGRLKNQITKGDFVVTRLRRVDPKNRVLYFEANGQEPGRDPYFSHFYSIKFDGTGLKLLTPEDGNHQLSFSPDGKYFVDNYSKPDVPPVAILRDMSGKLIANLEKADISRLLATGWKPPTPITVKDRNGKWDLHGLMFTPTKLERGRKYPVVNYIYPGPQGGGVGTRSFSSGRGDHQAVAELGFVVVVIDGTCNPGRSKSFHDSCYGDMADNTLPDQIAALKHLAEEYPFLDLTRVGIWGHSGGGFAAAAALFRYPDFYTVGISESGNHDNRNYEDDWGERYIGLLKTGPDGKSNYEMQANQIYAENLKGKLLLAHGAIDDNVPPYNTYLVVDALVKANKDFDLIIFPNARHGYGRDSFYMMRRRWDYFVEHLQGKKPPREYEIKISQDPRFTR